MGTIPKREDTKPRGALMQKKKEKKREKPPTAARLERGTQEKLADMLHLYWAVNSCAGLLRALLEMELGRKEICSSQNMTSRNQRQVEESKAKRCSAIQQKPPLK